MCDYVLRVTCCHIPVETVTNICSVQRFIVRNLFFCFLIIPNRHKVIVLLHCALIHIPNAIQSENYPY